MKENSLTYTGKILIDLVKDFIYFPLWWYSVGFLRFFKKQRIFLKNRYRASALGVWVKNIFTPMYGQTDFAGKIISFFIRLFQILARTILMIFWLVVTIVTILFYLAIPVLIIYALSWQFK